MLKKRVQGKELRVKSEKNFLASLFSFFCLLLSVFCLLFLFGTGYAQEDTAVTIVDPQTEAAPAPDAATGTQPASDTGLLTEPTPDTLPSEGTISSDSAATSTASVGSSGSSTDPDIITDSNMKSIQVTQANNSGTAATSIPIIVPPGRKGIQPNISLTYNSNSGNGWLGVGWSLDMGAIQRNTKKGLDYGADDYVAVFNGNVSELVRRVGTNYYDPKIEGEFSKYEQTSSGWIVTTKDGTKYYYGYDPYTLYEAKQDSYDTNGQYRVFKWCLVRVQDTNGNYMTIEYDKDNGEIYLSKINYTGNYITNLGTTNYVKFYRESRTDQAEMYTTHAPVITAYRLKTIDVWSDHRVRAYKLSYAPDYSNTTSRSLLTSIQQYGNNAGLDFEGNILSGDALPAVSFTFPTTQSEPGSVDSYTVEQNWDWRDNAKWFTGDFNGDGLTDYMAVFPPSSGNSTTLLRTAISNGNGTFEYDTEEVDWNWDPDNKWFTGDVNGDGKTDFMSASPSDDGLSTKVKVAILNDNGTFEFHSSVLGWDWKNSSKWFPGDIDGDGRTDFMVSFKNSDNNTLLRTVTVTEDWTFIDHTYDVGWGWSADNKFFPGDVNGDGKTDFMAYYTEDYTNRLRVAISNGDGTFEKKGNDLNWGMNDSIWMTGDINGDGLSDFMAWYPPAGSQGSQIRTLISKGDGTFEQHNQEINWGWKDNDLAEPYKTNKLFPGDVNGDGKTDFMAFFTEDYDNQIRVATSNGDGTFKTRSYESNWKMSRSRWLCGDINGDGLADFMSAHLPDDGDNIKLRTVITEKELDLLTSVNNGVGGTTDIEYMPSSKYDNCIDIDGKDTCLPFVVQTLAAVTQNDGNGNSSIKKYTYSGGYYDYTEREFRGFQNVKSRDCLTYQNNECTPDADGKQTESLYFQDNIFKGLAYDQVTKGQNDLIYTRTKNKYLTKQPPANPNVNFPYLQQQDNYVFDGVTNDKEALSSAWHTAISFTYDDYGNVTSKTYEDVTYPEREDKKTEYTDYFYDTANYIVSLPSTKYVTDKDGNTKAQDWFTYYSGTTNLHTKESSLQGAPQGAPNNPITTYDFYTNGNLWKETDPKNNPPTVITYDLLTSTFPEDIWNPLDHNIHKTYDTVFVDKVKTETDANLKDTTYDYDTFGRLTKITRPQPYGITTYSYPDLVNPSNQFGTMTQHIRKEEKKPSGELIQWKETYFDGLGRTVSQKLGGPNVTTVITDTKYNSQGLVWKKSNPYFSGAVDIYNTVNSYDSVGRLVYTLNPDSTETSIGYMQGTNTYIDSNYHKKEEIKDMYGRTIVINEYTGTAPSPYVLYATTTYWYDVLNNLEIVQDASDNHNQTEIIYDTLSRKTSMDDPDMGHWEYQYDLNGNLIYQKDAKLQEIYFQYDELNRLRQKDYGTQKTLGSGDIVYTYDQGSLSINPVGRLTTLTDNNSVTIDTYAYDPMGQITETGKTINSQTYTTKTDYDSLGRVNSITYPDNPNNLVVNYTYDALDNVTDITSNSPVNVAYRNYNAKGQYGTVAYANGVITTYQYNPYNNRLTSIEATSPTEGPLMDLAYDEYDGVGNIKHITDSINYPGGISRTRSYAYDDLDRLIETDSPSYSGKLLYQYDKIGNMTYNCKYGYYYYNDPNHVHAVTTIKKTDGTLVNSYSYDPNGNMYAGAGRGLTYDYDNRPISINSTTFVYDHAGQRVKKNATIYIDKLYECTNNICKKYIFAGSQRIANISTSGTYYYHADHLGSSSVVTDQTGVNVEEITYYPYGETRTNTGTVNLKHKFTGQEEDSETGLYYYGARYYDPKLARWISPDPILFQYFPDSTDPRQQRNDWNPLRDLPGMGGVYNPKNMNLYSYAHMNPIKLLDFDGKVVIIGGHVAGEYMGYAWGPLMPAYHLYLILIPDRPQDFTNRTGWLNDPHGYMYATLGGQPQYLGFGNLRSEFNYGSDSLANATFSQVLETPKGMTDTQFINNLYNAAASYKNDLSYDLFPELTSGYNSNSYVAGVIGAAGGTPPVLQTYGLFQTPGYYSPIPFYMLNYNSTSGSSNNYNNYETEGSGSTYSSDYEYEDSW